MQTFFLQDILTSEKRSLDLSGALHCLKSRLWTAWLFILLHGITIKLI